MPFEEYILFRDKVSAMDAVLDLIEISTGFNLPLHIFNHPIIKKLRLCSIRMTAWSNECFSARKEFENNEASNMVLIIEKEQNCTRDLAYEKVADMHNAVVDEFINLRSQLPNFGDFNSLVKEYVIHLGTTAKGHFLWSFHPRNLRYQ